MKVPGPRNCSSPKGSTFLETGEERAPEGNQSPAKHPYPEARKVRNSMSTTFGDGSGSEPFAYPWSTDIRHKASFSICIPSPGQEKDFKKGKG